MINTRDFAILLAVALYDTLIRSQISKLLFPSDDGRITRKRLKVLQEELGLLNRTFMRTVNPAVNSGMSCPVYYMSAKGAEYLAQETGENSYQLLNCTTPYHLYLYHFVAVADTHIMLDKACALAGDVEVAQWIGERTYANPVESDKEPHNKYRLYTRIDEKIVCVPDAAFLLKEKDGDFAKVYYIEQDRDTTKNADRVAAQKCQGYAGLAEKKLHLSRHFPNATWENFNVLCIAPTPGRRDALRTAVMKRPGGQMWKFASLTDLNPETFLVGNVWHQGDKKEPSSLLIREAKS